MLSNEWLRSKRWMKPILLVLILTMALLTGCGGDKIEDPIHDNGQRTAEEIELDDVDEPDDKVASVEGEMEVHFIDVGQGDAVLIKQDGSNMLIDAGENNYGNLVIDYLEEQGVQELDFVVGTHPHSDHIGGLDDVINHFPVGTIIMPNVTHTSKTFEDVLLAIENKNLKITKPVAGDIYNIGDGSFTIVGPNSESYSNLNDYSVMVRLSFGENSFMLTGDAESKAEDEAVANGELLESDVLKAGHHGSDTSTTDRFLEAVDPDYAVVQVGEGNQYNHPSESVISKLERSGVKIYRNDLEGNVIAISDGVDIRFESTLSKNPSGSTVRNSQPDKAEVQEKVEDPVEESGAAVEEAQYIGNKNSKAFHKTKCGSLPNEDNRAYFNSRDEAVNSGYKPCGNCKP